MKKIAFLFAGQGAQAVGMGRDLAESLPVVRSVFDMGDRIRPGISDLCFAGDPEELKQTENTQPCLYLTDYAIAQALVTAGVVPAAAAGFSLGEIPALAFAGVMTDAAGFRFVSLRGKAMAEASEKHPGGMAAALKLTPDAVERIATEFSEVWPVNYNCPGQVSCAGDAGQIDAFCEKIKAAGGRGVKLPVSGAFHTPYMKDVAPVLREALEKLPLQAPQLPVYANRTSELYPADREGIITLLSEQVMNPVRWEDTLRRMAQDGIDTFVEVGAGATLTGFVRRTLPEATALTVNDFASYEAVLKVLLGD